MGGRSNKGPPALAQGGKLMERSTDEVFATCMRRYQPGATETAIRMLGDADEAEDVVQDALTRIYREGVPADEETFRDQLMYRVRRMAKNSKARSRRREARREHWTQAYRQAMSPAPDEEVVSLLRVDAETARRALAALPPMQRACFELIIIGGHSAEEAARRFGIHGVTAREHAARARRALVSWFTRRTRETTCAGVLAHAAIGRAP